MENKEKIRKKRVKLNKKTVETIEQVLQRSGDVVIRPGPGGGVSLYECRVKRVGYQDAEGAKG